MDERRAYIHPMALEGKDPSAGRRWDKTLDTETRRLKSIEKGKYETEDYSASCAGKRK